MGIRILIADDEEYVLAFFRGILTEYSLTLARDGRQALAAWESQEFDLILLDIRMPHLSGLEVLREIRSRDSETMVIMISAFGDMDSVIAAMRQGANDFFAKPFGAIDKIRIDIENCLQRRRLLQENRRLRAEVLTHQDGSGMVYTSKGMQAVVELATRAAALESPVLVQGESGTGKELVARHIHRASPRSAGPFLAVNCGALSRSLLEPSLFGYEKGAFTGAAKTTPGYFEAAHGGTIFLDEIGETEPSFQIKLLRVLQEGEFMRVGGTRVIRVDFRLISATNRDLARLVQEGAFRKDLFYRINVVRITVPSLRERPEDIPVLLEHFLHKACSRNKLTAKRFSPELVGHLTRLAWEGNVRELENLVERLMVCANGSLIGLEHLPDEYVAPQAQGTLQDLPANYEAAKKAFEQIYLERLLGASHNDLKQACRISGLDLSTLYRKKNRYQGA